MFLVESPCQNRGVESESGAWAPKISKGAITLIGNVVKVKRAYNLSENEVCIMRCDLIYLIVHEMYASGKPPQGLPVTQLGKVPRGPYQVYRSVANEDIYLSLREQRWTHRGTVKKAARAVKDF